MSEKPNQGIWVAVLVERGFVSEVRAYGDETSARRRERSWRQQMNPDYDETEVSWVTVDWGCSPEGDP